MLTNERPRYPPGGEDGGLPGDGDLAAGYHGRAVPVIGVAADVLHAAAHVVDVGHHVPGHLGPQRVPVEVEGDVGGRRAHRDTQHLHAAPLQHPRDRVDGRRLDRNVKLQTVTKLY